jgi:hypothetical protein
VGQVVFAWLFVAVSQQQLNHPVRQAGASVPLQASGNFFFSGVSVMKILNSYSETKIIFN